MTFVRRILREPLVHFLLLGAALFGVSRFVGPTGAASPSSKEIQLSPDDLARLTLLFQSQWSRPPTPNELERLIEDRIREDVLYREALALGLDKDDAIVRRRMAQKMQFLAEDVAAAHEPTPDELKRWYASNSQHFALSSRTSFRHLYFSPDRRAARARDDAAAALAKLGSQPEDTPLGASLADRFMFQDYYGDRTPEQLAKDFGPAFARAVERLAPGSWQGPIESGYGWHLVFVDAVVPGRVPAFEEVEPDVKVAWLSDQKDQAWRTAYAAMRAKYTVLLPAPNDVSRSAATATAAMQVPTGSGEGTQ